MMIQKRVLQWTFQLLEAHNKENIVKAKARIEEQLETSMRRHIRDVSNILKKNVKTWFKDVSIQNTVSAGTEIREPQTVSKFCNSQPITG